MVDAGQQRRWLAYANAATACAIHLGRAVAIGDLDLSIGYRGRKLEEINAAFDLPFNIEVIPPAVCFAVNWGILAQVEIGRPQHDFAGAYMIDLRSETDPIGLQRMRDHWAAIERLANTLLKRGRMSAAEAIKILDAAN